MKDLTYTIIDVQVGAEKYWEYVSGYIESDKETIILTKTFDEIRNESIRKYKSSYFPKVEDICISLNDEHPLLETTKRLSAKVYGGFLEEKNFHLLLPTRNVIWGNRLYSFKYGDILFRKVSEEYEDECPVPEKYNRVNFLFCEESYADIKDDLNPEQYKIVGNVFKEYARTGIIENDLYKQFFK